MIKKKSLMSVVNYPIKCGTCHCTISPAWPYDLKSDREVTALFALPDTGAPDIYPLICLRCLVRKARQAEGLEQGIDGIKPMLREGIVEALKRTGTERSDQEIVTMAFQLEEMDDDTWRVFTRHLTAAITDTISTTEARVIRGEAIPRNLTMVVTSATPDDIELEIT